MRVAKFLLGSTIASALVMSAGVANAGAERHGWYIGAEYGWVWVDDTALPGSGFIDLSFERGDAYLGTVGYAFDGDMRLEFEGGYRKNDLDTWNGINALNGDLKEYSFMVNFRQDLQLSSRWLMDIGVGAGWDNVRFKDPFGVKDGATVLGLQGIAGLTYRLTNHWDLTATYRYLWTDDPDLVTIGIVDSMDVTKQTLSLGLRFGYNEPPPPVAPEPPKAQPVEPPKAKQFIIFFGFNKCNITAEADAVLSEAAAAAKSSGSASVRIVGHTDSSGSAAYNQKLSECRADAAASNLVGKGVAEGSISTSGKGESELMVQTGDGVKEPQNRRATVDLE